MMTDTWWLNRALIVGMPAPEHRMVHRVVVHQGGEVDQLDHRRERHGARVGAAGGLVGQQQQRGPEHLALHLEQVRVHLGDQAEVRLDDAAQLLPHPLQPRRARPLEVGERDRRGSGGHARRPAASRWTRSPRSMNRMSTARARS